MSAALSQRLTAKPVSLSSVSWRSQRPRSPWTRPPRLATVVLYVRSKSFHDPGRSFPHVIRMIMACPPVRCALPAALEVLHGPLVLLGRRARRERPEIAAPAGLRILLARIEAVPSGRKLANHRQPPRPLSRGRPREDRRSAVTAHQRRTASQAAATSIAGRYWTSWMRAPSTGPPTPDARHAAST